MTSERERKQQSTDSAQAATKSATPDIQLTHEQLAAPTASAAFNLPTASQRRDNVLALQRTVGNRAVQRLLTRQQPTVTPAQPSSVIARKGNKKGATPAPGKKPGVVAAEAAAAAAEKAKTAATDAEDREASAAEATTAKETAEGHQRDVATQVAIFDAAFKKDAALSGWKNMAGTATIQAASAVSRATTAVTNKTTAEDELKKAEKEAKTAKTWNNKCTVTLGTLQTLLAGLRTKEQQTSSAATAAEARIAANAALADARKISNADAIYSNAIATIQEAVRNANESVSTISSLLSGAPIIATIRAQAESAAATLELARDTRAIVDLILVQASQSATRVERVASAKELALQKAEAARDAKLDAEAKAEAIKEAEKAAKALADLAGEAQKESDRLGAIKRDADALADRAAQAYVATEAKANEYRALADNAVDAEDYMTQGYRDAADDMVSDADLKRTDARAAADQTTAPKEAADQTTADASKLADDAKTKAEDPATLEAASKAATSATTLDLEATTAASDRDATQLTAEGEATTDASSFAQQARLRALAGTQRNVNALSTMVPDPAQLETLLTRFGGYDLLNKLLTRAGGQANLESLISRVPANDKLEAFLNLMGFEQLDRYLNLPLTVTQIDGVITRVPFAEQLDRLMTNFTYTRLDTLLKQDGATPAKLEKLWAAAPTVIRIDALTAAIEFKILDQYIDKGVTGTTLEDFVTKIPDAAARTTVMTACEGDGTLLSSLLTKTGNSGAKLAAWLSPAGGQKAASLNGYLNATRQADLTRIWDASQTTTLAAVPITSPPGQVKTLAQIMASAVPMMPPSSEPLPGGYAGKRQWGAALEPGDTVLPRYTAAGAAITYTEYDITPYTPGVNRGPRRVVVGNDGRKYYTADHYAHFKLIS